MALLPDHVIERQIQLGGLNVEPFDPARLQPASLDVTLAPVFRHFKVSRASIIDVKAPADDLMEVTEHAPDDPYILHPGCFVLGATVELVELPADVAASLSGKSSLGRLGLIVHATAGWIDPGFRGTVTLELANVAPLPITLYPGMAIGQLAFQRLEASAREPYHGKYTGQVEPTASKMHLNFKATKDPNIRARRGIEVRGG